MLVFAVPQIAFKKHFGRNAETELQLSKMSGPHQNPGYSPVCMSVLALKKKLKSLNTNWHELIPGLIAHLCIVDSVHGLEELLGVVGYCSRILLEHTEQGARLATGRERQ